jgi:RNA polymerase sigma-70 factor (ECF subfamily)
VLVSDYKRPAWNLVILAMTTNKGDDGSKLTDAVVIQKVRAGCPEAFGILVRRYQARLRAMVARYIANHDDVYDLVQDTFLEAFIYIDRFDPEEDFLPWLRSLARHHTLNFLRRMHTRYKAVTPLIIQAMREQIINVPEHHDDSWERLQALRGCFAKLSPKYQQIIRLRYTMQVAVKDIAEQYNRSVASISSLLYRLREILARCVRHKLLQREGS